MLLYVIFLTDHCFDGNKTEDETGVDCGGSCRPCSGLISVVNCLENITIAYRFNIITHVIYTNIPLFVDFCYTGEHDGDETGVDCGGSCTPCGG